MEFDGISWNSAEFDGIAFGTVKPSAGKAPEVQFIFLDVSSDDVFIYVLTIGNVLWNVNIKCNKFDFTVEQSGAWDCSVGRSPIGRIARTLARKSRC